HPGGRLPAFRGHARGTRQPAAVTGRCVSAPGSGVPLPRAHRLVASEDRTRVRRTRPHHRDSRDLEDHAPHPRGSGWVQPRARTHGPHQAGPVEVGIPGTPGSDAVDTVEGDAGGYPHAISPHIGQTAPVFHVMHTPRTTTSLFISLTQ